MYIQQYLDKMDFIPRNVNLENLNSLIEKHTQLLAFSSINVLLGKELSLKNHSLFERVITQESGGYCFEHNKIFNIVLKELGFEVKMSMARVVLGAGLKNARTHRINIVTIESQDYLVDVGFGSLGPIGAILIESDFNTSLGLGSYKVIKHNNEFHLRLIKKNESPIILYTFDTARYTEKDCEQGHFYSHKHPEAIFVNNLVVSKISKDKIIHIINREFITQTSERIENVEVINQKHLNSILSDEFGITLSLPESEILFNKSKRKKEILPLTSNL
jgi:N-hydroxyarylamine O-acetyltransferase